MKKSKSPKITRYPKDNRYYILKDGKLVCETFSEEEAIRQVKEYHEYDVKDANGFWLLPNYQILTVSCESCVVF